LAGIRYATLDLSATYTTSSLDAGQVRANGRIVMADYNGDGVPDLIYIQTHNTSDGNVAVQVLSGASGYQTKMLKASVPCNAAAVVSNGFITATDTDGDGKADLAYVKELNTGSGNVELKVASASSGYQAIAPKVVTSLDGTNVQQNGKLLVGGADKCSIGFTLSVLYWR